MGKQIVMSDAGITDDGYSAISAAAASFGVDISAAELAEKH